MKLKMTRVEAVNCKFLGWYLKLPAGMLSSRVPAPAGRALD